MFRQTCFSVTSHVGCALSTLGGPEVATTHARFGKVLFLMHSSTFQPSYAKVQFYQSQSTNLLQMKGTTTFTNILLSYMLYFPFFIELRFYYNFIVIPKFKDCKIISLTSSFFFLNYPYNIKKKFIYIL